MSCFIINDLHINALVTAATRLEVINNIANDPDAAGQMLVDENQKSYNHRYPDHAGVAPKYSWKPFTRKLTPVEIIKAAQCLEYNSDEHPGWKASEAHKFLERLMHAAISKLDGYDEAQWDIQK